MFPNGDTYEGEWENDKASGQGTFTRPNGNRFEGRYRDDKSNGWGVYTFSNGDRYEGQWRDGMKTGNGTITWADGRRFEGTFSQDCPVSGELTELGGAVYTVVYDGRTTFGRGAEPLSVDVHARVAHHIASGSPSVGGETSLARQHRGSVGAVKTGVAQLLLIAAPPRIGAEVSLVARYPRCWVGAVITRVTRHLLRATWGAIVATVAWCLMRLVRAVIACAARGFCGGLRGAVAAGCTWPATGPNVLASRAGGGWVYSDNHNS